MLNIWIFSFLVSSLHLYSFKTDSFNGTTYCAPSQNYELFEIHAIFLIISQFLVPFLIISVAYSRIIYKIYSKRQHESVISNQEKNKKKVICFKIIILYLLLNFNLFNQCLSKICLSSTVHSLKINVNY